MKEATDLELIIQMLDKRNLAYTIFTYCRERFIEIESKGGVLFTSIHFDENEQIVSINAFSD
jgi:hypothetical protein